MLALRSALFFFAAFTLGSMTHADVFRPAYLELKQQTADTYDVLWKVPAQGEMRLALYVHMPETTQQLTKPRAELVSGAFIERWQIRDPQLNGQSITIEGLQGSNTDVLVRVARLDGTEQVARLLPATASFIVTASPGAFEVARTYLTLGVQHILSGVDHLLFVLTLIIIVQGKRRLLATVTAFTLAHSITLVLATLNVLHIPSPPVEATIALSIVFVASEILHTRAGRPGLAARKPWVIAFVFGLLHGLGFAGALAEVGLPQNSIPLALLCFNVGVEIGQIIFIAAVLSSMALLMRLRFVAQRQRMATTVVTYAIGAVASFWVFERIAAF